MSGSPDKTKWKIAEALKSLLRKKSLSKITVQEIIDCADVARPTFYRHFRDKYDLVNWYFQKLCDRSFFLMGKSLTLREALTQKFAFLKSEQDFFTQAFRSEAQNSLVEYDYQCIHAFYTDYIRRALNGEMDRKLSFVLEMYCRGSIDMTAKWARDGMKQDPEEIVDGLILALPPVLSNQFEKLQKKSDNVTIDVKMMQM